MSNIWEASEGDIAIVEGEDVDSLVLIITVPEIMLSIELTRAECESLASFLSEWTGLPIYMSPDEFDVLGGFDE